MAFALYLCVSVFLSGGKCVCLCESVCVCVCVSVLGVGVGGVYVCMRENNFLKLLQSLCLDLFG